MKLEDEASAAIIQASLRWYEVRSGMEKCQEIRRQVLKSGPSLPFMRVPPVYRADRRASSHTEGTVNS